MQRQYKLTQNRISDIFNEWVKRYKENPDEFDNILDENGNVVEDYGELCSRYFIKIYNIYNLDESTANL